MTYRVHETDLQLVDALQVNPRATWAEVGAALGVSAVTAARRWNRLEEQGLAWVNAAIGPERSMGAVLEVRCAPSDTEDVARALARFPNIITVGATTGDFQVFAILLATDLQELMRTLARKFTPVKGAVRIRHNIFRLLYGGVHWRQGVLSPGESRIMEPDPSPNRPRVRPLGIEDRALFRHLNRRGGRRPRRSPRNSDSASTGSGADSTSCPPPRRSSSGAMSPPPVRPPPRGVPPAQGP